MDWNQSTMYEQGVRFILEVQQPTFSFAESCRRYGISRTAGYTWWIDAYILDKVSGGRLGFPDGTTSYQDTRKNRQCSRHAGRSQEVAYSPKSNHYHRPFLGFAVREREGVAGG